MRKIFTNGGTRDFVVRAFTDMMNETSRLHLATPYFTRASEIEEALKEGKPVQLLVELNAITDPQSLKKLLGKPGMAIRYLTKSFHAKIYVFDRAALVGSANLTDSGMMSNREAAMALTSVDEPEALEECRALFVELWDSGSVLTEEKLDAFMKIRTKLRQQMPDVEKEIGDAVGAAEPPNVNVGSLIHSAERIFLESLRQRVHEEYKPAFSETAAILDQTGLRRRDMEELGLFQETNRFLNYVRLTHVHGQEAWQNAPIRSPEGRRREVLRHAEDWKTTTDHKVHPEYALWFGIVEETFASSQKIMQSDKEKIIGGLTSLHAFSSQRGVKGGEAALPELFWKGNDDDLDRVKNTLDYFIYGPGDFIERFHDIIYDPAYKLARFGFFSALELYGTVKPEECPPMNGRMAKALRYLGYGVAGD